MGALDGIRIVNLSERSIASMIASMVFADHGADVIHVEPPGGNPLRCLPSAHVWYRGQRSVVAGSDGLNEAEFMQLCATADVVIDTSHKLMEKPYRFQPDAYNRQIYCLLTAEPIHADQVGQSAIPDEHVYGELAEARYGLMEVQDGRSAHPRFNGMPHAEMGAAWALQISVLAAVFDRLRTGQGRVVTTSLVDGIALLNHWRWLAGGDPPVQPLPQSSSMNRFGNSKSLMSLLECSDGWLHLIASSLGAPNRLFRLLGRPDLVDPRLDTYPDTPFATKDEADQVWQFLRESFLSKTVSEWLAELSAADIAAAPVLQPGEALELDQAIAQGLSKSTPDGYEFGLSIFFNRTPGKPGEGVAEVGENTNEVRAELRKNTTGEDLPAKADEIQENRAPLEGVTVLDVGTFFAGPYCARLLGDLGANVVKVDSPHSSGVHEADHSLAWNHNKRSISVDLKAPEGRAVIERLISCSDIITHNQRFGVMDRLGLGDDRVQALNPRIIRHHSSGFGNRGPWARRPVFGPASDAMSGGHARAAGVGNAPVHFVSQSDFAAGLNGAVAVLMALIERERSKIGQAVESPQFGAAMLWMSDCILRDGKILESFQLDHDQRGFGPAQTLYPTSDGWVLLACHCEAEWQAAHAALRVTPTQSFRDAFRGAIAHDIPIARALACLSTNQVLNMFSEFDVPAAESEYFIPELLPYGTLVETGPLVRYNVPGRGEITSVGSGFRFNGLSQRVCRSPRSGEHSKDILNLLDFNASEISDLLNRKIVHQA